MAKVQPEVPLSATQLEELIIPQSTESLPSKPLPKHLEDFKNYVDSKCCYHSLALNAVELVSVLPKAAYRCQMKTLIEARSLDWKQEPASWKNESVLFSQTLGKLAKAINQKLLLIYEINWIVLINAIASTETVLLFYTKTYFRSFA